LVNAPAASNEPGAPLLLRLSAIYFGAEGVNFYEFRDPSGAALPRFEAGAHVDVHLPTGIMRQYSLVNPQVETDRYLIGVKHDTASRVCSRYMHRDLRVGTLLQTSRPRNNFPLAEAAAHSVFVAGGIGVTPIRCMIARLRALDRPWELHYAVRQRQEALFGDEFAGPRVHLHVDEETPGVFLDIAAIERAAGPDAHFYCCGPLPMLKAFEAATAGRPADQVHVEYFTSDQPLAQEGGFTVRLAKSGRDIAIAPGKTILDAVRDAGIEAPFSCGQGVCGACETKVLDGVPDHRDMILSPAEKASNKTMMICCSGAKTANLVLDI
jgi:tetrachlorobenzoquinone reductase